MTTLVGGALLLAACFGGVASSAPSNAFYGSLPPVGTPTSGGTISIGEVTGSTPTYIMPIVPAAQGSVYNIYEFINTMFVPLYEGPNGGVSEISKSLSLANPPVYSNGDKTITIQLKPNFKWSNGEPVDASDVIFSIDLLKAAVKENASNYDVYTPGLFPDNVVSATAPSQYTLVLTLTHKYNPSFFTNNQLGPAALTPMPSTEWNVASAGGPHLDYTVPANAESIYNYLSQQGSTVSTFATNPLWQDVDGPFKLSSFTASSGAFTLVPNSSYGGSPKPGFSELEAEPFTSLTAELNQVKLGDLDIAGIDFSQLGQVNQLKADGYSVFGSPSFGFDDAILNFKDKTGDFNNIVAQLYIRQAFASLIDEPGVLKGVLKGAGSLDYGTIPEEPSSPFAPANATKPPYPFSTTAAAKLLSSHGWKVVPNGTTKCVKPGTGAGECGKGIPAGTPIKFTWYYANLAPYVGQMSEAFASSASSIGIHVTLTSKTFDFLTSNFNDASSADAKYDNTWGVVDFTGFNNQYYPTTNTIFNTTGSFNIGGYSSAKANSLIKASEFSSGPDAVKAEASYLTINVPSLFLPDPDNIFAVKKGIGGPANGWMAATLFTYLPQYWYQTK